MSRYLVVAHQTANSPELLERATGIARDDAEAQFDILVPATSAGHLVAMAPGFPMLDAVPSWYPDADSVRIAQDAAEVARRRFTEAGLTVGEAMVGDSAPLLAIEDALRAAEPDGYAAIVLSTFPPGISRWLRLDVHAQAERRFSISVIHVVAEPREEGEDEIAATGGDPAGGSGGGGELSDDVIERLSAVDVFRGLSREELSTVTALGVRHRVGPDEPLLETSFYAVLSGRAALSADESTLGGVTMRLLTAGESFPLALLIGGAGLITRGRAISELEAVVFPIDELRGLLAQEPGIGSVIHRNAAAVLAERYRATVARLVTTLNSIERPGEPGGLNESDVSIDV